MATPCAQPLLTCSQWRLTACSPGCALGHAQSQASGCLVATATIAALGAIAAAAVAALVVASPACIGPHTDEALTPRIAVSSLACLTSLLHRAGVAA